MNMQYRPLVTALVLAAGVAASIALAPKLRRYWWRRMTPRDAYRDNGINYVTDRGTLTVSHTVTR